MAHLLSGAQWDPVSQGSILNGNISFDYRQLQAEGVSQFLPMLRQGGIYYRPVGGPNGTTSWITLSTGAATQGIFCGNTGCVGSPNFSSGALIEFGYLSYQNNDFTSPASLPVEVSVGVDNYNVTINSDTPEPVSLLLMGAGLSLIGLANRRVQA